MTQSRPDIPQRIFDKWQRVIDLAAEMVQVPSGLIMKTDFPEHAVLLSSRTEGNPYTVGQQFELNEKLYCHNVLTNKEPNPTELPGRKKLYCHNVLTNKDELVVRDAHVDPAWCDNEDLKHGMSFYMGYPLVWPDGRLFGTICVLDAKDNAYAAKHRSLIREHGELIENDLALLEEIARRKVLESELQDHLENLEIRVSERIRELEDANAALSVLLGKLETSRQEFEEDILRQITGLVLPHMAKLKLRLAGQNSELALLDLADENLKQVTSSFANRLASALEVLTPTEVEIAQLVMNGQTTKDIARTLSCDKSTIDFHRNNIRRKLGLTSRAVNLRSQSPYVHAVIWGFPHIPPSLYPYSARVSPYVSWQCKGSVLLPVSPVPGGSRWTRKISNRQN